MKSTFALVTAVAVAASLFGSVPASADLSPWEKFCLLNAKPGKDIDNCLNGLPSTTGGIQSLTTGGGAPTVQVVPLRRR